jgi:hypothetical protein
MKSRRGQEHVLEELIQRHLDRFLGMAHEIMSRRPTCISSILSLTLTLRAAHIWDRPHVRTALPGTVDHLQSALYRLVKKGVLPSAWWVPRLASTFAHGAEWVRPTMLKDDLTGLAKERADDAPLILRRGCLWRTGATLRASSCIHGHHRKHTR